MSSNLTPGYFGPRYRSQGTSLVPGRVERRTDRLLGREVVIKYSTDHAALRREFETLRSFSGEGAEALDFGVVGGDGEASFFTQPYIEGEALSQLRGRLSEGEIEQLSRWLLERVHLFHSQGVVSLDLKPEHLIRRVDGGWSLIDLEQLRPDDPLGRARMEGSPEWLAPEVLMGDGASPASDLYTVGLIIHWAARGDCPPLQGVTLRDQGAHRAGAPIPPTPEPLKAAPRLEALRVALLAPIPADRPPAALDALRILEVSPPPLTQLRRGALLGRREALASLEAAHLANPRGAGICVTAPPSGGLSRLLRAFVDRCQCAGRSAYLVRAGDGSLANALALLAGDDPGDGADPARALTALLRRRDRSGGDPDVLVVDDAQDLDREEAEALHRLAAYLDGTRLLLVIGVHGDPWPELTHHPLPALTREEVRAVAEELVGPGALRSDEESLALWQATEGRPGWVRDYLLQQLRGRVSDPHGWHPPHGARLAEEALEELSPADRALAESLSHLSEPFPERWARSLGALVEGDHRRLVAAGLLSEPRPLIRWQREPARRALAARGQGWAMLASSLSDLKLCGEEIPLPTLALACLEGGNLREGVAWAQMALSIGPSLPRDDQLRLRTSLLAHLPPGTRAASENQEALTQALLEAGAPQRALDLMAPVLGDISKTTASTAYWLSRAASRIGQEQRASSYLMAALPHLQGDLWIEGAHAAAWSHLKSGDGEGAEALLESARPAALAADAKLRLQQVYMEALVGREAGLPRTTLRTRLADALARERSSQDAPVAEKILNLLADLARRDGDGQTCFGYMDDLIKRAHDRFDLQEAAVRTYNRGSARKELGDPDGAATDFLAAAEMFTRLGDANRALDARIWALDLLVEEGAASRAEAELKRALTEAATQPQLPAELETHLRRLQLRLAVIRGDSGPAVREAVQQLLQSLTGEGADDEMLLATLADLAEIELKQGRPSAALELLLRADLPRSSGTRLHQRVHGLLSRAHAALAGGAIPAEHSTPGMEAAQPRIEMLGWVRQLVRAADDERVAAALLAQFAGEAVGGRSMMVLDIQSQPRIIRPHGLEDPAVGELSTTIVERVMSTGVAELVPDIAARRDMQRISSLRAGQARSMVCLPIKEADGQCLGVLYLDHTQPGVTWTEQLKALMSEIVNMAVDLLRALRARRALSQLPLGDMGLIGNSPKMRKLRRDIGRLAAQRSPNVRIYIEGGVGVGKTHIGRLIHKHRQSASGPFKNFSCGSLYEGLAASTLYGHAKGAFPDAKESRDGLLKICEKGTLLLDEIDLLSPTEQSMLLQPLQDQGFFTPLGSNEEIPFNAWLICASNRDLMALVGEGLFRQDLAKRILSDMTKLTVPSLKERGAEDILLLSQHYLRQALIEEKVPSIQTDLYDAFSRDAVSALQQHDWPTNVSGLIGLFRNFEIRERLLNQERIDAPLVREILSASDATSRNQSSLSQVARVPPGTLTHAEFKDHLDRTLVADYVRRTVELCEGVKRQAAEKLECAPDTIYKYLRMGTASDT